MFESFFWGGFEDATGHDAEVADDYRLLRANGVRVAREAVRWPLVDLGNGRYDLSSVDNALAAAATLGVQLAFDLFHYGYPTDADPLHPDFPLRFADYCRATAEYVSTYGDGPHTFTPVNESNHAHGPSDELKVAFARSAIAGIDAIRSAIPDARIVNVGPIRRAVVPEGRPDLLEEARSFNENVVFDSLDMIAGRSRPELGGSMRHLDIVGLSYDWTNQGELGLAGHLLLPDDPRAQSLSELLRWAYHRYGAEIVLAVTAHVDGARGPWIDPIADEAAKALDEGIPLRGVCLSVLGMPNRHETGERTRMGLWDLDESLRRVPHAASLAALHRAQDRLEGLTFTAAGVPHSLTGEGWVL